MGWCGVGKVGCGVVWDVGCGGVGVCDLVGWCGIDCGVGRVG